METTAILEKRMRTIALLAEDISQMYTQDFLSIEQRYHETICFINEILRSATGLADQDEEILPYE